MKTCDRHYRVRAVKSVVWEEGALSAIERQLRIVKGPVTPGHAPVYGRHLTGLAAMPLVTGTMDEEALLTSASARWSRSQNPATSWRWIICLSALSPRLRRSRPDRQP